MSIAESRFGLCHHNSRSPLRSPFSSARDVSMTPLSAMSSQLPYTHQHPPTSASYSAHDPSSLFDPSLSQPHLISSATPHSTFFDSSQSFSVSAHPSSYANPSQSSSFHSHPSESSVHNRLQRSPQETSTQQSASPGADHTAAKIARVDNSAVPPLTSHGKPRERVYLACLQW